jgi:hypothetical protein
MKTYTEAEFRQKLIDDINNGVIDCQVDNEGQLVIYTGLFQWNDSIVRDEADPNWSG